MSAQHDPDVVARYAKAVRAAVDDLGPVERAQLLDDLEAHLQEVVAESGATLTERLGPPEVYAAELRAAYGAPPRGASGTPAAPPRRPPWRRWRPLIGIVALVLVVAGVAVWQASMTAFHPVWLLVLLVLVGVPFAFVLVLAALLLGVLWRLFRRLGRPTGIM
jgi:hypothetical protein